MYPHPKRSTPRPDRTVVAIGGNAITRHGEQGTVAEDYANLQTSLEGVVDLVEQGFELLITHGNGPQVGNQLIRVEAAKGRAPDLPLDIIVADLQGGMGYMIETVLRNKLLKRGMAVPVCALLTQIEVAANDPALDEPTKFVGPSFTEDEAGAIADINDWVMRSDTGRGWRRVVPSPSPIRVVERDLISTLFESGALVIVGGGGGIPVTRMEDGSLQGVEGVIDKDLASALLAHDVGAPDLFLLTSVDAVYVDFGTDAQRALRYVTLGEARDHLEAGQFPSGSMGPKMEAACRFLEAGGRRVLITDVFKLGEALRGSAGTWITR